MAHDFLCAAGEVPPDVPVPIYRSAVDIDGTAIAQAAEHHG